MRGMLLYSVLPVVMNNTSRSGMTLTLAMLLVHYVSKR